MHLQNEAELVQPGWDFEDPPNTMERQLFQAGQCFSVLLGLGLCFLLTDF